jgi:hypothetical protein
MNTINNKDACNSRTPAMAVTYTTATTLAKIGEIICDREACNSRDASHGRCASYALDFMEITKKRFLG